MLCYTQDDTNTEGNHVSLSLSLSVYFSLLTLSPISFYFSLSPCLTHSYIYLYLLSVSSPSLPLSVCLSFQSPLYIPTYPVPPLRTSPPRSLRFISVASINKAHVHYCDITIRSRDERIVRQRPFVVARCHF